MGSNLQFTPMISAPDNEGKISDKCLFLGYLCFIFDIHDRNFSLLYFIDSCLIFLAIMVVIGS